VEFHLRVNGELVEDLGGIMQRGLSDKLLMMNACKAVAQSHVVWLGQHA
jgi:hypothetical protein